MKCAPTDSRPDGARSTQAWAESNDPNAAQIFSDSVLRTLTEPTASIRRHYETTCMQLADALQLAGQTSRHELAAELPPALGLPILDATKISKKLALRPPPVLGIFGNWALARYVRSVIEKQIGPDLREFLDVYARQLRARGSRSRCAI